MRCAIYARYSTKKKQKDVSIDDQVALCRQVAEREHLQVVAIFADRGKSGASAARPQLQAMIRAMERQEFDAVVCESTSRLGRRSADTLDAYDRMHHRGIKLFTVQHGLMNEILVSVLGMVAQMQLKEQRAQTVRGQRGVVRDGRIPGGLCYGYEPVPGGRPGEHRIVETKAAVVRRIHQDYASGLSANAIALKLNAENIPGPRGGPWHHTTICGHRARGTGILNNRRYIGENVYGTMEFRLDPHGGQREGHIREGGPLETGRIDALRIIDDELWERVQRRHAALDAKAAAASNPLRGRHRASYPFSGLLFCGCCGHGYQIIGKDRYGCSARRVGRCENSKTVQRPIIERRILAGLKERLLSAGAIETAVEEARRALAEQRKEAMADEGRLRRRLGETTRSLARLIEAIEEGTPARQVRQRMAELEAEHAGIERQLAALASEAESMPAIPHPRIAEAYRRKVEELEAVLGEDSTDARETLEFIRGLIERVEIKPDADAPNGVWLEIRGDLAQLLRFSEAGQQKPPRAVAWGGLQLTVDAGTRIGLCRTRIAFGGQ